MLVIPWGGGGLFNYYYLKSYSLPAPPPRAKKKVIIIGRPPPLRRKKVIIIQHPPAPLTGSGSYFCLSSRFWELVLSLISSTAVFLCIEIRFLRLLNVFLGAFSASESVSEFLDAVLSFFTARLPPPQRKKKVIIIDCPAPLSLPPSVGVAPFQLLQEVMIISGTPLPKQKKSNNNRLPPREKKSNNNRLPSPLSLSPSVGVASFQLLQEVMIISRPPQRKKQVIIIDCPPPFPSLQRRCGSFPAVPWSNDYLPPPPEKKKSNNNQLPPPLPLALPALVSPLPLLWKH